MKEPSIFTAIFLLGISLVRTQEDVTASQPMEEQVLNVTSTVFSGSTDWLPMAFGDFNGDKLTDIFMVAAKDRSKVAVLLAQPETFSLTTPKYFDPKSLRTSGLECTINGHDILGVQPADFDGDGGMDVLLFLKGIQSTENDPHIALVLWGDHSTTRGRLVCVEESIKKDQHHELPMKAEPLIVEANGDNIADIFSLDENGNRSFWLFGSDRRVSPTMTDPLVPDDDSIKLSKSFRHPHSNSFVDMNNDGRADLFVTTEDSFEMWKNTGIGFPPDNFKLHAVHKFPKCGDGESRRIDGRGTCIGQSVFADFDLDGRLDMIFPICNDEKCDESFVQFVDMQNLWAMGMPKKETASSPYLNMPIILNDWNFDFSRDTDNTDENPYRGLSPRMGDINLDGYPDFMIRLRSKSDPKKRQMHFFLNIINEDSSPVGRGFLLQPQVMAGLNATVVSAFYDLYENGLEDIITVSEYTPDPSTGEKELKVAAYTNRTQDSDAYFVKVIVLSGVCFENCMDRTTGARSTIQVPYGTNLPGQTICYSQQRPNPSEATGGDTYRQVLSCAAQLTQTAHTALQLPYTIFGIGLAPNFLDYMYVNVTNSTSTRSLGRSWSQIIPNSQMYVIPYPPLLTADWEAKLYITPSRGIMLTGLALVGTCLLCLGIIAFFHWRERLQDKREKLQEANRFHFDAM